PFAGSPNTWQRAACSRRMSARAWTQKPRRSPRTPCALPTQPRIPTRPSSCAMSADAATAMRKVYFREAIARALREEMERDASVIVLGQDIGRYGGAYKEFAGLFDRFGPARVRDTPVAESSMVGLGVGAAAAGLRPLVAITYMDFLMLGLDALVNYAAKARYKTGGQLRVPMVVKTTAGARGQGVAHSQCIEAWAMSVPGLAV